jgi:hypothetical protein
MTLPFIVSPTAEVMGYLVLGIRLDHYRAICRLVTPRH